MIGRQSTPRRNSAAAFRDAPGDDPQAERAPTCAFCDRPPTAYCRRCGRGYCPAHGKAFCQLCSDPSAALPSPQLFQVALWGLPVCFVLGLIVFFAAPRLPGERAAPSRPSAAVATSPTLLPTTSATPAGRVYAVQQGDTLQSIATKNGTTIEAIQQLNPGLTAANLPIGQVLRLPPATPTP